MIYVQFLKKEKLTIISWFAGPQNPDDYPYFDTITADDPRWVAYYESQDEVVKEILPKPIYS